MARVKDNEKYILRYLFCDDLRNVKIDKLLMHNIKFCSEKKKALKYIKKINFNRETIFTKNLVALLMNRMQVKYNKPTYAEF